MFGLSVIFWKSLKYKTWVQSFKILTKGILLYEMFQDRPPYNTRLVPDLKHLIENQPIFFFKTIDSRLKNLIRKILNQNPLKRPSCREILMDKGFRQLLRKFDLKTEGFLEKNQAIKRNR